jgi:hypothetical protein
VNEENSEVYAWYGQAVAIAQGLEAALIQYLSILRLRTPSAKQNPSARIGDLSTANLGALQREMEKYPSSAMLR